VWRDTACPGQPLGRRSHVVEHALVVRPRHTPPWKCRGRASWPSFRPGRGAWLRLGWLHQQGRQPPAGCRGARAAGGSLNPEEDGFGLNCALRHGEVVYLRSDSTDPELVIPLKAVARGVAMYFEPS